MITMNEGSFLDFEYQEKCPSNCPYGGKLYG